MKLELKKLNQPDGKVWYAVSLDGIYQSPFHHTEGEAKDHYDRIIEVSKQNLPKEEVLLTENI